MTEKPFVHKKAFQENFVKVEKFTYLETCQTNSRTCDTFYPLIILSGGIFYPWGGGYNFCLVELSDLSPFEHLRQQRRSWLHHPLFLQMSGSYSAFGCKEGEVPGKSTMNILGKVLQTIGIFTSSSSMRSFLHPGTALELSITLNTKCRQISE